MNNVCTYIFWISTEKPLIKIPRPASNNILIFLVSIEKVQSKAFLTLINRRIFPKDVFSIRLNIYSGNFGNMMRTLFFGNAW